MAGQLERARNRRGGHHQQVRRHLCLGLEHQPLGHAEAMLLVHHHQPQVAIGHALLEDRMGADQQVDLTGGKPHQNGLAHLALVAPGEDRDADVEPGEQAREIVVMLAGEDLGGSQHRALRSRLGGDQQRHRRYQRLARADIALEQAEHRLALRHVALDLADRARLGAGGRIG